MNISIWIKSCKRRSSHRTRFRSLIAEVRVRHTAMASVRNRHPSKCLCFRGYYLIDFSDVACHNGRFPIIQFTSIDLNGMRPPVKCLLIKSYSAYALQKVWVTACRSDLHNEAIVSGLKREWEYPKQASWTFDREGSTWMWLWKGWYEVLLTELKTLEIFGYTVTPFFVIYIYTKPCTAYGRSGMRSESSSISPNLVKIYKFVCLEGRYPTGSEIEELRLHPSIIFGCFKWVRSLLFSLIQSRPRPERSDNHFPLRILSAIISNQQRCTLISASSNHHTCDWI